MRYVLTEAVKVNEVTYPEGTECVAIPADQVPKRFVFMRKMADRIAKCMDQKHLVVLLDGEARIIRKKSAEPVYSNSGANSLPMRL